jgi:UDP-GlcNAc:undecaprenyl-phosphate/decaprenyl-phosphate GlcNAc-1-phosphate transferase
MFSLYVFPFISGFIFSLFLTLALIWASKKFKLIFMPQSVSVEANRNSLRPNVSRLGGSAIILSFALAIIFNGNLAFTNHLLGFLAGAALILFVGVADDFFNLSPTKQLLFQFLISLSVVLSGIRVDYLANPLGGVTRLDIFMIWGYPLAGSVFIIVWIIFLMNVLNWADGLDGLAGGIGAIGAISLFFLSISTIVNQPPLGIISIAFLGSVLGFLLLNFPPAKIFMGTSGSMFIGFALGVISIFSGAKLATLALVLSVPILDALWVIVQRIKNKKSIFKGDRSHLHHRLLSVGFSERQITVFYYIIAAIFGLTALSIGGLGKLIVFAFFSIIMAVILISISLLPLPENRLNREGVKTK